LWERVAAGKALGDPLDRTLADGRAAVVESGWYARVVEPGDAAAVEGVLYAALGSPIDTRLDRAVHRRLSRPLSRLAVRFGFTPNQVTLASLAVGLAAAWCFWEATVARALAGLALYAAAVVLDHADGEVARLTLAESTFGQRLDVVVDTVVHVALVLALGATAQHAAGGGWLTGVVAAGGVAASAVVTKTSPSAANGGGAATALAALGNRNGYYAMLVIFIALLAARPATLPLLMGVIAAGCYAFWLAWLAYALTGRR
ncbi:MAG: CDP-alcohol phosphatidyltransferase family protein, partial [Candidatus Rokuibacteriota bacterium]